MVFSKQAKLLLSLFAIIFVVLFAELPGSTLYWRELQNTGHTFLFFIVAILSLVLLQTSSKALLHEPAKAYAVACGIGLLLAVITELVQSLMNSDASATDVLRDFAGIASGLGLYSAYDTNVKHPGIDAKKNKLGIRFISISILLASLAPLAYLSVAYVQRGNALPVVVDLKANWSKSFLQLKSAELTPSLDNRLTTVMLSAGIYPGLSIIEPYPDWSAEETFNITIVSQYTESFNLVLRIHDTPHNNEHRDRFNKKLVVKPGKNIFKISLQQVKQAPQGREMDMKHIRDVTLFAAKVDGSLTFSLGTMSLE